MKRFFILALILLGVAGSIFGQKASNTSDQALRGSGRVNPSTLGMEFDLPLGSYAGRGINVPISISYSSKQWRMESAGSIDGGIVTGGCRTLYHPRFSERSASGWTTSLATPYIEYTDLDNFYDDKGFPYDFGLCVYAPPPTSNSYSWVRRLTIHLPSGESHELRADDVVHEYSASSTCPPSGGYSCDPETKWLQSNWNATYYAVDGSNIRYVENSNTNTYVLYMPDGSKYEFDNARGSVYGYTARKANKFTDRNGNYTSYNSTTGVWTDTLGRTLSAPIQPTAPSSPTTNEAPIEYSLPGMTGKYKFHWKNLKGATAAESALTDFNQDLKYTGDKITQTTNGNWTSHPSGTYLFHSNANTQFVQSSSNVFNPILLTKIELPTGQSYEFSYNIYGLIERIKYPTGGEEKLTHEAVAPLTQPAYDDEVTPQTNFGVTNRKLYMTSGGSTFYEWAYSAVHVDPSGYKVSATNPDGTITERFLHQGDPPCTGCMVGTYGYDNVLAGMLYEQRSYSNTSVLVSRKLVHWTKKTFTPTSPSIEADWHPRVTHEESIVYDASGNGVSATTKYEYEGDLDLRDTPVLVNKTTQYAFVPISGGGGGGGGGSYLIPPDPHEPPEPNPTPVPTPIPPTPVKIVETQYLISDPAYAAVKSYYTGQNMFGLVTASQVKDGAGTIVSRSETVYDESGRSPGYRGNPTTSRIWDSTKGVVTNTSAYIATHAKFDIYGNQYEAIDAKGCVTSTEFDTTYQAFPVEVTTCAPSDGIYGSSTPFVSTATFDFTTGLPLTTTDANGLRTEIEYDTATRRPRFTRMFSGSTQVGSTTETIYHDEPNNYWVKNRAQIDTNLWAETITYYDGLGRAWKTEEVNSNGNIFVEKEFDSDGRVLRISNPFRSGETKVWTTNVYDEASRVKEVVLQDGSKIKTDYGVSVTGVVGITKQITDQAGKKREGITDALGRMVRVIEDPTGVNLSTDYVFDTLGNLRRTIQGEQNRFFMHDSLGRLLFAKQPEQNANAGFIATDPITGNTAWSVKYEYDDNGNITRTTDARGIYIDGAYDNFNRLKTRNYSDSTPDVDFYYDGIYLDISDVPQTATGSVKGKTTGVRSSVSRTNYTSFDDLGRLLTHQQITDGQTYPTSYTYNLSGALIEETYPSGRVVKNTLNGDGDLAQVHAKKNAGDFFRPYASNISYNASGAVEKMKLGNGRWETAAYNNRLQITQIGLGSGSSDTSLLKLQYSYGDNTLNNGSLREQKISFNGLANPFEQTYTYDDLNRLQVAEEKVSGSTTWKQTFVIDRYGNRRFDAANTTTLGSCTQAVCNPLINTSDNRFSSGQGYAYDQNGSVTQDSEGKRFAYDAENHQTKFFAVGNGSNDPDATYSYDGDGRRIKKVTVTETTVFVYNASGQLVAEYSTQISQTPRISYVTADHLGSPRVVTDEVGAVVDRKDYTAFGEESFTSARVAVLGYATADDIRKGYTGYEKETESGLDFAQARYYNATHGRYTSIDPLTSSANTLNPQTFNRYSYVLNSPYKFSDPLGLLPMNTFGGTGCSAEYSSCEGKDFTETYYVVTQTTTYTATSHVGNNSATITVTVTETWLEDIRGNQVFYDPAGRVVSAALSNVVGYSALQQSQIKTIAVAAANAALNIGIDVGRFLGIVQGESEFGMVKTGEGPRKNAVSNPSQYSSGRAQIAAWGSAEYAAVLQYNLEQSVINVYQWAERGSGNNLWNLLYRWNGNTDIEKNGKEQRVNFANRVSGIINGIQRTTKVGPRERTGYFESFGRPTSIPSSGVNRCITLFTCR
ncbi:MAG TPA: RHS repeat-associated core domain-containing protein [Pyrinomonadaceae bacterium]|nr:RHS repeat-associated core domain-containing protein [Pyrinomonadaceae bacterium]